jgi:hypothetical protein
MDELPLDVFALLVGLIGLQRGVASLAGVSRTCRDRMRRLFPALDQRSASLVTVYGSREPQLPSTVVLHHDEDDRTHGVIFYEGRSW